MNDIRKKSVSALSTESNLTVTQFVPNWAKHSSSLIILVLIRPCFFFFFSSPSLPQQPSSINSSPLAFLTRFKMSKVFVGSVSPFSSLNTVSSCLSRTNKHQAAWHGTPRMTLSVKALSSSGPSKKLLVYYHLLRLRLLHD